MAGTHDGPAVALVGFMGSGKSAVGRELGAALGIPFLDTDDLVVAQAGPIDALFSERGEAAFRAIESVVVTAGPSGVGTAAIQIARHIGANPVIATTRTATKAAALRALGAHEVVDTRDAGWADKILAATNGRGVDVIIDHVGGPMLAENIRTLALRGRLVSGGRNAGFAAAVRHGFGTKRPAGHLARRVRYRSRRRRRGCRG